MHRHSSFAKSRPTGQRNVGDYAILAMYQHFWRLRLVAQRLPQLSREARMATNPRFIPEKEKRIIRSDAASLFSSTNKVTLVASLSEHPTVRRFYKLNNASIAGEKFQREREKKQDAPKQEPRGCVNCVSRPRPMVPGL
jgi:hypothetical protein